MELLKYSEAFLRKDILPEGLPSDNKLLMFAYSDYGGSTLDQANIKYILANVSSDKYVHTYTGYNGEIMYLLDDSLIEEYFIKLNDYPLLCEDTHSSLEDESIHRDFSELLREEYNLEYNVFTEKFNGKPELLSELQDFIRDNFRYTNSFTNVDFNLEEIKQKINHYLNLIKE